MPATNQKGIVHLFLLILLIAGIGLGVYLVSQKTQLFPWAASNPIPCSVSSPCPSVNPSASVSPSPTPTPTPSSNPNTTDSDSDGFLDAEEAFYGTDPKKACGISAWPPDVNNDGVINGGDSSTLAAYSQKPYDKRYDLDMDQQVTINNPDLAAPFNPIMGTDLEVVQKYFLKSCGASSSFPTILRIITPKEGDLFTKGSTSRVTWKTIGTNRNITPTSCSWRLIKLPLGPGQSDRALVGSVGNDYFDWKIDLNTSGLSNVKTPYFIYMDCNNTQILAASKKFYIVGSSPMPSPTPKPSPTLQGSDGTWCYDSDGNGNTKTTGSCVDSSGVNKTDYCEGNTARDGYCSGSWNGTSWTKVHCESGGYVCSGTNSCKEGVCASPTPTPTPPGISVDKTNLTVTLDRATAKADPNDSSRYKAIGVVVKSFTATRVLIDSNERRDGFGFLLSSINLSKGSSYSADVYISKNKPNGTYKGQAVFKGYDGSRVVGNPITVNYTINLTGTPPKPPKPVISGLPACSNTPYSMTVYLGTDKVSYVDISQDPNFSSYSNKYCLRRTTVKIPDDMLTFDGRSWKRLILEPGKTYYVRSYDASSGQHSPISDPIKVPKCK